jgi:putative hydrolase of the HAD superfamily
LLKLDQVQEILDKYSLYLVDMDNTLYDERDFVLSGFRAVADHLAGWDVDSTEAYNYLQNRLDSVGREKIFDHLLKHLAGGVCRQRIQKMVQIYRGHHPQIDLFPGTVEVLRYMRRRGRVVIVTDGLPEVQQRKVKALGLDKMVDQIVYCWATGYPKPDPRSLVGIVKQGDPKALMIGDREDHDMKLARGCYIDSIRVTTPFLE